MTTVNDDGLPRLSCRLIVNRCVDIECEFYISRPERVQSFRQDAQSLVSLLHEPSAEKVDIKLGRKGGPNAEVRGKCGQNLSDLCIQIRRGSFGRVQAPHPKLRDADAPVFAAQFLPFGLTLRGCGAEGARHVVRYK